MNNQETWFIARLIGALRLERVYGENLKLNPESYFCLNLVVINGYELNVLLNAIDISDLTNHLEDLNKGLKK
ncbi:MAG TPA: hypothetical protein VHA56_16320 [Mucilaginibacter sp.]|nr:hypothetical protein [Mucilaginibacter sp.]